MGITVKDGNSVAMMSGIDNVTGLPVNVRIDPVTDRVLAEIYIVPSTVPVLSETASVKDGNSAGTTTGIKDNDSTSVLSTIIDNRNNLLYADILVE